MMKDFFISYNNADRNWAEWIAWKLEEAGYTTVVQAWDSRPGKNFVVWMQQAASEAKRTIAVLSKAYHDASFTQPEWAAAFQKDPTGEKGTLLPIRVEECDLSGLFHAITYIDLVDQKEAAAREALLKGVKLERIKPTTQPGFPGAFKPSLADRPKFPGFLTKMPEFKFEEKIKESKGATKRQLPPDTIIYKLYLKPEPPIRANYQELKTLSDSSVVGYVDRDDYHRSDRWPEVLIYGASQKIQNGLTYNQSHRPYSNKGYDYDFKLVKDGSISFSETLKWENVEHLLFDADDFLENLVLFCFYSCQWLENTGERFNHEWTSATIAINAVIPNGCLLHSNKGLFRGSQSPSFESLEEIKEFTSFDFKQCDDHDRLSTIVDRISGFIFSEFSFKVRDQVDFPVLDIKLVKSIIKRYSE